MELLEEILILIDDQCAKKKINKSKLSERLGKHPDYLSNMFNSNKTSINTLLICEIAIELECELSDIVPS